MPAPALDAPMAPPAADGRTGRAAASCVFWVEGERRPFSTVEADHGNCSVGAVTHGFRSWSDVAGNDDVASIFATGWVDPDDLPSIPVVAGGDEVITYGVLGSVAVDPDVVVVRLTAEQAMVLHDAIPELQVTGKPQCQILALAKDRGEIALSLGCALSRVRMGLPEGELTCAIPGARLAEAVDRLDKRDDTNDQVRSYAAEDAGRFG